LPKGSNGKILRVDLGKETIDKVEPGEVFYRRYMGGRCLSLYYLLNGLSPKADPLSPENILIFATSIMTGVPVPGTSRYNVAAKSPLTSGYGEAQAGGFWGAELKFAGYDAVIIQGRAKRPAYLWIHDGEAEIKDASQIWGKVTGEAEDIIRTDHGDHLIRVAQIGPGGENKVRYACILNECKHANGRTGMGAVMGSKNLKAIAVRGHKKLETAYPERVKAIAKLFLDSYMDNPSNKGLQLYGTSELVKTLDEWGELPTRNFQTGIFRGAEKISGETMSKTILTNREGCYSCPVRCKRIVQAQVPYEVDPRYGGPEYETCAAFGSDCGVDDLIAISKANELCNKYGLDTISTGAAIAFAMECYEKDILSEEDMDGLEVKFGNSDAMLNMIEKIAHRTGIGNTLAEGTRIAAARIGKGSEKYAMHAKGQELPMHDPRAKFGLGLAYAISPFGGDHIQAEHDIDFDFQAPEIYLEQAKILGISERLDRTDSSLKKVRMFYYLQNQFSFMDSLCGCLFAFAPVRTIKMSWLTDLLSAITGWEIGLWELMKLGERGTTMSRIFNVREGFTSKDDKIPERFFKPIRTGPLKGARLKKKDLVQAVRSYYRMIGWNAKTGIPTREKLYELDIEWATQYLKSTY
jgi:aldehyde:ferredoxin oxidoreductase